MWMGTRGHLTFLAMRPEDTIRAVQLFLILQAVPLLCLAAVIDERQQTKDTIDERLRFEKLLAHLSRAFVWVASADLDQRFQQWLKLLGGFFKADHLVLLRVSADRKELEVIHSWSASAESPGPTGTWDPYLSPEGLRKVRRWTESRGYLLCPLTIGDRVLGGLALKGAELGGIPRAERARRLELVAEVFANALQRKQSEEERDRFEFSNRQMRDELAHATRLSMMGELTASLAHELNQPLTGILGNAQAARRILDMSPPDIDELRAILSDIIADDRRAGEMILRVRNLVRKGATEMKPLDMNVLVKDVARLLRSDAMMRNLDIRLELAADPLFVKGDHAQLQQVIVNLLLNAMDAMANHPGSDGQIVVRSGLTADRSVEVSVRDSGIGLAQSNDRIFEPFFTTKAHGMGMGLSITRSIVEAHEGSIRGENCPGGGAVFYVVLPSQTSARGLSAEATRLHR
jgi:C4-dicarboxylate-specific signal transduction histidine kinase